MPPVLPRPLGDAITEGQGGKSVKLTEEQKKSDEYKKIVDRFMVNHLASERISLHRTVGEHRHKQCVALANKGYRFFFIFFLKIFLLFHQIRSAANNLSYRHILQRRLDHPAANNLFNSSHFARSPSQRNHSYRRRFRQSGIPTTWQRTGRHCRDHAACKTYPHEATRRISARAAVRR